MPSITLRDGSSTSDPRLDRLPEFDPESRNYGVTRLLTSAQQAKPRSMTWPVNIWLDQGQEGACVSFGISHELAAAPAPVVGLSNDLAKERYWEIQRRDPWEGGSYPGAEPMYEGTSVLSGVKYYTELGYYSGYNWAFSEEELMLSVGWKGPAIIGVNWYEGMFNTNSKGFIAPEGQLSGGHCTLIFSVNVRLGYYRIWNSWGPDWGNKGTARISRKDMATLLQQDGEVCLPQGRNLV